MMDNERQTILIVDDEPGNVESLAMVLSDKYDLRFAMTGKDALNNLEIGPVPSLVLLDIGLPDISGLEVCRAIKDNPATNKIPVIFVTGQSSTDDETTGFRIGAADFIRKPIRAQIVRARVKVHVDLKLALDELQRLSSTDALTGLSNRREFDQALAQRANQLARNDDTLGLFLLDVDHFKKYNDIYGHPQGDECLRQVSAAMKSCLTRPEDLIARIGGEEFACLLSGVDDAGATALAGRILRTIRQLNVPHEGSDHGQAISISIGMAVTSAQNPMTPEDFYKVADKALYAAKANGRNCFKLYDPVSM